MIKRISVSLIAVALIVPAHAIDYKYNDINLKISGYGTAGGFLSNKTTSDNAFLGDYAVRAELSYEMNNSDKLAAVYSVDELSVSEDEYINELYGFYQSNKFGRIEIGITDSVATKMGLGLPDVGGLRINNTPIFYDKIDPNGPYIDNINLNNAEYSARINYVLPKIGDSMYGISVSNGDNSNFEIDGAWKYKDSFGKTKTAYSLSLSYVDSPTGYKSDYTGNSLTADWRAQVAGGVNIQYNSFMFSAIANLIYDKDLINPAPKDGLVAGGGISYDLLSFSASVSYLYSDTTIFKTGGDRYNSVIGSLRYKFNKDWDVWMSGGYSVDSPFLSSGIRYKF